MKALKIFAAIWFAIIVIGGPTAYLLLSDGSGAVESASTAPRTGTNGTDAGVASIGPSPVEVTDCESIRSNNYGRCYQPEASVNPLNDDERPVGIERFLLLGSTDADEPGNATASFLMAFFGLCALVVGVVLGIRRTLWMPATALIASGIALFLAAQILWNGAESRQWAAGLAFLALNAAVLGGLGFLVFKGAEGRKRLTIGISASVIAATVLVQAAVFYNLIGTPDAYDYPSYTTTGIRPLPGIVD